MSTGGRVVPCGRSDITKLIVTLHYLATRLKIEKRCCRPLAGEQYNMACEFSVANVYKFPPRFWTVMNKTVIINIIYKGDYWLMNMIHAIIRPYA